MRRSDLKAKGFHGFLSVRELSEKGTDNVPCAHGVYTVLRIEKGSPRLLSRNRCGHYKGRDPTIPVSELRQRWIDGTEVLYIGRAAGKGGLNGRIGKLLRFAQGHAAGHWGGRYIWQVAGSRDFLVAWLPTPRRKPAAVERQLMEEFRANFGSWPLANPKAPDNP